VKGLLFTLLLTYGGALVSLFRPFVGLLIYICFAIIKPEALWYWSVPAGNYSRIVFGALFIGWAMAGFGSWRLGRAWPPALGLAGYLIWSAISATQAADQTLAWQNVESTAKIVIPALIGLTLIDSFERIRQVAWVIVAAQGYLALEFNLAYYSSFNRLVETGFAGMDEKTVAFPMVVAASLAIFLALSAKHWAIKAITLLAALLMMHVPLFTFSRGGMLALGVSFLATMVVVARKPSHLLFVALALAAGVRLAGPEVRQQFSTTFASEEERDWSAQSRLDLWGQAWETMLRHPLTGVGPRHWGEYAKTNYDWGSAKEVHNTWFQTGAELGFPGVTALVLFFLITWLRCWPLARGKLGSAEEDNSRMVICALSGYAVGSQFITAYGLEVPFYVAMMGCGLLTLTSQPATQEANASPQMSKPALGAMAPPPGPIKSPRPLPIGPPGSVPGPSSALATVAPVARRPRIATQIPGKRLE
jgi:putative inorganic carbon (hco3(-)) transporter